MLLIVGVTPDFSAAIARREMKAERIHRIAHGIYCEPDDARDLESFMKVNAFRIINHLFENAVVGWSSAYYKGPVLTQDEGIKGKYSVFVATTYSRVIDLPHVSVVCRKIPQVEKMRRYCNPFDDGKTDQLGEMTLRVASDELVFLQSCEARRHNLDRFLDDHTLTELRDKLLAKHSVRVVPLFDSMASHIGDLKAELQGVRRRLLDPTAEEKNAIQNLHEFTVAWHRHRVGKISYEGVNWKYDYDSGWILPLSSAKREPSQFPSFIMNLLPQGFLLNAKMEGVSNANESAAILCNSERYLHNLVITSDASRIDELPIDYLHGRLSDHIDRHAVFTGQMVGVPDVDENFVVAIKALMKRRTMPVISGYQPKMPMHLSESGQMWPAENDAFTHILKFPGVEKDKYFARGAIEWASMQLARAGGVDTCDFAITTLSDGSVAYLAERFDIPENAADSRLIISEDFNSVRGKSPYTASVGTLEYAWSVLSENSTNFEADAEALFKHICATIILENGDLHLKNMSLVKVASPTLAHFTSVRLSPSYDIMNTKFFGDAPKDTNTVEPLTMSLNNKFTDITSDDLLDYAEGLGIDRLRADEILHSVACGIAMKAAELYDDLPEVVDSQDVLRMFARMTCMRAISQVSALAPDALTYEPNSAATQRSRPRP